MKTKSILLFIILTMILALLTGCGESTTKNEIKNDTKSETKNEEQINAVNKQEQHVAGESGSFVKYKNYTYYWKLTANSRTNTALFANYKDTVNSKNNLVKVDENGNEEIVLTDKGSGEIFIVNDKIFLSYATDEYGSKRNIYSTDLNGQNKTEYNQGEMKYIVGDYIICQSENNGDIYRINTKTDETETLKNDANIIGVIDETIYYTENYDYQVATLKIGSITENKDNGIIATFSTSEFKEYMDTPPIEITQFWEENDKINMYIGYRLGTANMLQELFLMTMDKDGKNVQKEEVTDLETISMEDEQTTEGVYFKTVQKNGEYSTNLMYVDEQTKQRKEIMTEEEINEKFNFTSDDEHTTTLYTSSIIDNEIYIVLDYGEHYSAEDIGWRYSYKRAKTMYFKYDIKTEEITEIYEF